jgi:hypothetical protein
MGCAMKEFISRDFGRIFVIAVILNYPWERTQSVLYRAADGNVIPWWHCMLASLGDGLLVLIIFGVGWVLFGHPVWFEHPGVQGYVLMAVMGLAMIIPIEWILMYRVEWWSYTVDMYLVPGLAVGVSPIIQMLLLPPLIFWIVALWRKELS